MEIKVVSSILHYIIQVCIKKEMKLSRVYKNKRFFMYKQICGSSYGFIS